MFRIVIIFDKYEKICDKLHVINFVSTKIFLIGFSGISHRNMIKNNKLLRSEDERNIQIMINIQRMNLYFELS